MGTVHERAAGIDISKKDAKVCLRVPGKRRGTYVSTVTTWGSTAGQVLALQQFLLEAQVTTIVMESTSDYWKPFYYVFEETLPVVLVNAKAARNIPGRKKTCPMPPGSPSSARTGCCALPSCHRLRSASCGT